MPALADVSVRDSVLSAPVIAQPASACEGNSFGFLNTWHDFGWQIDWTVPSQSRLWQYNLHYFDYALDPSREPAWISATMQDWVDRNPPGKSVGWEPYPASLRIVNWIKFDLLSAQGGRLSDSCRRSLYQQAWWLERNLEYEIQANHLLKNAKALLFAGARFRGRDADRWLRRGRRLFLEQIEEQILPDGAHYERSAMYHAIVLEDMLDVLNLAVSSDDLMTHSALSRLIRHTRGALGYLRDIAYPGGALPMFNDSVAGIAPNVAALATYAHAILPFLDCHFAPAPKLISKPYVGHFGYRREDEMLLIDAGRPAPPYQPGHSHCGLLSFELTVAGRPVIVDSGVYDYEDTPLRHLLRSTAAHNTLRIDGKEQSDIWGAFRMGRRASPGGISLEDAPPHRFRFSAFHDGYRNLPGRPLHRRTVTCRPGRSWEVVDEVSGSGSHVLESFLHFHPSLNLDASGNVWLAIDHGSGARYRITPGGGACECVPSIFCPRFGVRESNWALRLRAQALLPATLTYTIETA